jgi:hypothetical protein
VKRRIAAATLVAGDADDDVVVVEGAADSNAIVLHARSAKTAAHELHSCA